MKITKDYDNVGMYVATYGEKFNKIFAVGNSPLDALNRMFEKLQWREFGNWNREDIGSGQKERSWGAISDLIALK